MHCLIDPSIKEFDICILRYGVDSPVSDAIADNEPLQWIDRSRREVVDISQTEGLLVPLMDLVRKERSIDPSIGFARHKQRVANKLWV